MRPTLEMDGNKFIATIRRFGESVANGALRAELGWKEQRYWRIHGLLADAGKIARGRGRGGTVKIVAA